MKNPFRFILLSYRVYSIKRRGVYYIFCYILCMRRFKITFRKSLTTITINYKI